MIAHHITVNGRPYHAGTLEAELAILDEHADKTLHHLTTHLAHQAERGIRAWLLAPTLDLYHALMRGEQVPAELLNADALARYGIKR